MSDRKDQPKNEYDLESILTEFGSGKYRNAESEERPDPPSKVVEFPKPEEPFNEPPPVFPKKESPRQEELDEIVPETVGRRLAARLSTLLRRADHYADHMYDQAEPDEATRKAEKYIPGTDKEELPPEEPRPRRKLRQPVHTPPDTAPADLAARYRKGLKGKRARVWLVWLTTLLSVAVSLELPFFSWQEDIPAIPLPMATVRLGVLAVLLLASGLLALEIPLRGLSQL